MRWSKTFSSILVCVCLGLPLVASGGEDTAASGAEPAGRADAEPGADADAAENSDAAAEETEGGSSDVQPRGTWDKRPTGARRNPSQGAQSGAHREAQPADPPPGGAPSAPSPSAVRKPPPRPGASESPAAEAPDAPPPPPVAPPPRRPAADGLDTPVPQDPGPNPLGRPNRVRRAQQGDALPEETEAAEPQDEPRKVLRNPSVRIGSQREGNADEASADPDGTTPKPPRRLSAADEAQAAPELDPSVDAPTKIVRKTKRGANITGALERLASDAARAPTALRKPLRDYEALANGPLAAEGDERLAQFEKLDRALTSLRAKAKASPEVDALIEDEQSLIRATVRDRAIIDSPDVLNANHALELKRVGIRPSAASRIREFQDGNLEGEMKELGSGALNVVYRGKYRRADGSTFDGVFKEEATESRAQDGDRIGIPRKSPRFGLRNLATTKLDQLLGYDNLTTASAMALHKGKLGTVSEFAEGETPAGGHVPTNITAQQSGYKVTNDREMDEVNENLKSGSDQRIMKKRVGDRDEYFVAKPSMVDVNYDDPRLRRDLVRLQIMDSIAGQVDRHPGNYKIRQDADGNVLGVKAFDNDLAWGGARKEDGSFLKIKDLAATKLPPELPPFVDDQTYQAVKGLTKARLQQEMDGLLSQEEVDAAAARLEEVQAHFANLAAKGRVLKSVDDWKRPDVTAELTKPATPGAYDSYVARDLEIRREKRAQGVLVPYPGSRYSSQAPPPSQAAATQ